MSHKISDTGGPKSAYTVSVGLTILSVVSLIGYFAWFVMTIFYYFRSWRRFFNSDANKQVILHEFKQPISIDPSQSSVQPQQRKMPRNPYTLLLMSAEEFG